MDPTPTPVIINLSPPDQYINLSKITFTELIKTAIGFLMVIAVIIFFFMILGGGIGWITSQGDKAKLEDAKRQIANAFIGLLIIFSLWTVGSLINNLFGITFFPKVVPVIPPTSAPTSIPTPEPYPIWITDTNRLPEGRYSHSVVYMNGYLYVLGGVNWGIKSNVFYAPANLNGSTGVWNYTIPLPTPLYNHTSASLNGFIYVLGGDNGSSKVNTVYYTKANSDGSLNLWSATTSLPAARDSHSTVITNSYIYVIGGNSWPTNTVYFAKVNIDGSLSSWNTTTPLPSNRNRHASVTANGYIYVIGGASTSSSQSTVYYAATSTDGSVGAWNSATPLPRATRTHSAVILNGYIYVIGGDDGISFSEVFRSEILADGSLSSWEISSPLPEPLEQINSASTAVNGRINTIGGLDETGNVEDSIRYTTPL